MNKEEEKEVDVEGGGSFRAIYKSTGAVMINREPETDEEYMYMQQVVMDGLIRDAIKSGKNIIFPDEKEDTR